MKKPKCQNFCGKAYGWISFFANLFNASFKIGIGLLTGSQALIADGFHSLSDSLTAIVTIVTLKISEKPSDEQHPYGHGKVEFLASAFFSIVLLTLGVVIMGKAIYSVVTGDITPPNFLAVGPAVISILVNIAISNYGLCVGREIQSPVITANAKENRADAMSSVATLLGIVAALAGFPMGDPLAAMLVAVLISRMGFEILSEAIAGLMDSSVEDEDRKEIRKIAKSVPDVKRIVSLRTRRLGQQIWADVGIAVSDSVTLNQGDEIANEVRNALLRNMPNLLDAVVYFDAVVAKPKPVKKSFFRRLTSKRKKVTS